MRPTIVRPLTVRGAEFGGPRALFCIPLVATGTDDLLAQARAAHTLRPDVVEWRSDAIHNDRADNLIAAATALRCIFPDVPVLFTLRSAQEGGLNKHITQAERVRCIEALLPTQTVDIIDIEFKNDPDFLMPLIQSAHLHDVRVILSFHDFQSTPDDDVLIAAVSSMAQSHADIAKLACMPRSADDVLRLLSLTSALRLHFPELPLSITSMGGLGALSRVAGFLYGSDMAFAVGTHTSAPGQIPIAEARTMANSLLRFAGNG